MKPIEIDGRTHLIAGDGKRITRDGENYAVESILPIGGSINDYYEISQEEYEQILREQQISNENI